MASHSLSQQTRAATSHLVAAIARSAPSREPWMNDPIDDIIIVALLRLPVSLHLPSLRIAVVPSLSPFCTHPHSGMNNAYRPCFSTIALIPSPPSPSLSHEPCISARFSCYCAPPSITSLLLSLTLQYSDQCYASAILLASLPLLPPSLPPYLPPSPLTQRIASAYLIAALSHVASSRHERPRRGLLGLLSSVLIGW